MSSPVRDIDKGWRALMRRAIARDPAFVTVGVQGSAALEDHDGISNARLAGVHEFGARIDTGHGVVTIPQRSFIRSTFDERADEYRALAKRLANLILDGRLPSVVAALSVFGEKATSDIKGKIEAGIDPPNAPSTVARKGSSKPLVDTGVLKNAITYEVRRDR